MIAQAIRSGLVAAAIGCASAASAQNYDNEPITVGEQILRAWESSFEFPWEDLYKRRHNSEWRELLSGISITASAAAPLDSVATGVSDSGEREPSSPTAQLNLRYQPLGHWFANVTLYGYLRPSKRRPWNPDFTYSFGYDDWRPYTFSLVYSNYSNNRFDPRQGDPITRLTRGNINLSWKPQMPATLAHLFLVDDSLTINCRVGVSTTPRFERVDGTVGSWKRSAHFGCRYPFTEQIFIDMTAFAYEHGKQPWDPDFTYAFGYFDYRPGRLSIQYSNYSGNRYPGGERAPDTGRFKDGSVTISWSQSF